MSLAKFSHLRRRSGRLAFADRRNNNKSVNNNFSLLLVTHNSPSVPSEAVE